MKPFYDPEPSKTKTIDYLELADHIISVTPNGTILLFLTEQYETPEIAGPFPNHQAMLFDTVILI